MQKTTVINKLKRERHELEARVIELEAELNQCLECCKRVGELEQKLSSQRHFADRFAMTIGRLEQENKTLQDALTYAMDYMDSDQRERFRTILWPELNLEND